MTSVINWQFITSVLRQYNVKMGDRARTIEGGGGYREASVSIIPVSCGRGQITPHY